MDTPPAYRSDVFSILLSLWGILGVSALLGSALWRLTPIAVEGVIRGRLQPVHWISLFVWVTVMAYSEGYRGFQLRFSPRTAARALHLGRHPRPLRAVLAPLFCMGFFAATRRVLVAAWGVTLMVVALIILVHSLDQPWRGIVDAGVVVGLAWGLASLLWFFVAGLVTGRLPDDPQVPKSTRPSRSDREFE